MFCKNCGNPMDNMAAVCVKCGVQAGLGMNFCPNCGNQTAPGSAVCTACGVALTQPVTGSQKSKMAAGLLGIFLGCWGVHNFYLGYTAKAVIQLVCSIVGLLLSCLGIGVLIVGGIEIWGLVEGIMILCGSINVDGKGIPLKD